MNQRNRFSLFSNRLRLSCVLVILPVLTLTIRHFFAGADVLPKGDTRKSIRHRFSVKSAGVFRSSEQVNAVKFSPDGHWLATGSGYYSGSQPQVSKGSVQIWNLRVQRLQRTLRVRTDEFVTDIDYSPDSKTLVSTYHGSYIRLWDVTNGRYKKKISGPNQEILVCVAVSPDGDRIASGWVGSIERKKTPLRMWDVASGRLMRTFRGSSGRVSGLDFSPDGKLIGISQNENRDSQVADTIRLYTTQSSDSIRVIHESVNQIAFSPNSKLLASAGKGGVRLWDVTTGQMKRNLQVSKPSKSNEELSVVFSPDGKIVASGGNDHRIKFWNIQSGKLLKIFLAHTDSVTSLDFSRDGQYLASGSWDHTAKVWRVDWL